MRGCDLRGDRTGLDQLRNHPGPLLPEQVRAGQAGVAADHDQPIDPALQQVPDSLAPAHLGAKLLASRGAEHGAAPVQDPPYVRGLHAPDGLASVDQTLKPVMDHEGVDAVEQRRPNHCPDRGVHPAGVPAAGEYRDAGGWARRFTHGIK